MAADGQEIRPEHLPIRASAAKPVAASVDRFPSPSETLDGAERTAIQRALEASGNNHTAASELLGISRRTLLRKLKQYRQGVPHTSAQVLGKLSPQQQLTYRSATDIVAMVRTSKELFQVRVVNVSQGGIGVVAASKALGLRELFVVKFSLPQGDVEASVRVVWASPDGHAGIQFINFEPGSRERLTEWLRIRQMEDGWGAQESLAGVEVTRNTVGR